MGFQIVYSVKGNPFVEWVKIPKVEYDKEGSVYKVLNIKHTDKKNVYVDMDEYSDFLETLQK